MADIPKPTPAERRVLTDGLDEGQKKDLKRLAALLRRGRVTLIDRRRAGRLVAGLVTSGDPGGPLSEYDLARLVGSRASLLGKCRRFSVDFDEADAARWDAAGLVFASVVHSDAAPDKEKRRAFIEEGLTKGWDSGKYRAEARKRWPRCAGAGGPTKRVAPADPGLVGGLLDLFALSERWVETSRAVWRPEVTRGKPGRGVNARDLGDRLGAAAVALAALAQELAELRVAVAAARGRLAAKRPEPGKTEGDRRADREPRPDS